MDAWVVYDPSAGFPQPARFGEGKRDSSGQVTPPEGMGFFEVDLRALEYPTKKDFYEVHGKDDIRPVANAADLRAAAKARKDREIEKRSGFTFDGTKISYTGEDQAGLIALLTFRNLQKAAGLPFPPTRFEFSNGESLVVTDDNFDRLIAAWIPKRSAEFVV